MKLLYTIHYKYNTLQITKYVASKARQKTTWLKIWTLRSSTAVSTKIHRVEQRVPAVNHPSTSANQNDTINISRETLEDWPSCFPFYKLKRGN